MKIALVMEWSQSPKNEMVYATLKEAAEKHGHTVDNFGQFSPEDHRIVYPMLGIIISTLLESKAYDFVVTGCGTGQGACMAANAMPGVVCGIAADPLDAYLFTQVNNGNCLSLPFSKGYGWGGEINIRYMFERLFEKEFGQGYPASSAKVEQENKGLLDELKQHCHQKIEDIILRADRALVRNAFGGPSTLTLLEKSCRVPSVLEAVKTVLA